jgi:uncharacterized membrane protein YgdD (TMEM256/DUF423 family)
MQLYLMLGAICAFVGVGLGAFGAHGLKTILEPDMLAVYQTGVTYQMWHSLGLILVALLSQNAPENKWLIFAGRFMFVGIVLFSGSLYLLALLKLKWLGMITPFGGLCFLAAWLSIAVFSFTHRNH